jgi:malate dehydrogenase (oxaloacetate-decarboxylating)
MDIFEESVKKHEELGGKMEIRSKIDIQSRHDLSLAYTPGVAGACEEIAENKDRVYDLTMKKNTVAVVTDGSAVLGLGNIGPEASLPVMEGKAILFKQYANIDAFPICLSTQNTHEIIETVQRIAPTFGGINLEDIAAPRCFEIEQKLQDLGIPVFHDDQHGTAITLFGALINAAKLADKPLDSLRVVINGAGAAGTAIAEILMGRVKEILVCDSAGIISKKTVSASDQPEKFKLAALTNKNHVDGSLKDALVGADVFIGVSVGNVVTQDMVRGMADKSIIFALANPIPEILPDEAKAAGAFIVGTGRSDFNNQVNNVLIFPGIFRGAIDAKAPRITDEMKIEAAYALARSVENPTVDMVLPPVLDKEVAYKVAKAVENVALKTVAPA